MSKRTDRLRKENNKLEEQIQNQENLAVLTDLIVYIRSANISSYDQEQVRRDIWEMIVEGEKRGETAKNIIGEDMQGFCDRVIAEIPKVRTTEYILTLVRDVLLAADVLLGIWVVFQLVEQRIGAYTLPYISVTVGNMLCAVLCIAGAFLLFYTISKNTFHISSGSDKKGLLSLFSLIFVLLLICMGVNALLTKSLFQIHILMAVGGIIILFLLYKVLDIKVD
ncbi:hypothetical protein [Flintibacter sp. KGMB00164]|uniref:hypothetical protein n=1 Tax=Flintibacter sp. KGMB00164 TaxID=2610895 RepID=UPI001246A0FC|nr:hypothetical protein [Flintibacter sp. KGMB00164]